MASVYLARIVGPSGFESVVVIKRMLPHLAEDERFRQMFADEGRTVAKIRHPNVVRTFELVAEADDFYLVMEYLEGDSLQRLAGTLAARKRHLSPGLACFLIAEAAAGLHAAHELVDEDGKSLHVVHRDVSPHNIFVTFDGSVKVIDFGIAKSLDQANQTSTGELKGKFAYMSPEQVMGQGTSRQTDVFALGITLWELLTRRRLFHRENQMLTLRAVADETSPSPSTFAPDIPPGLEAICMRCLARDPKERYATMAELRRELLIELRRLDEPDPRAALAALMQELFEKSIALRRNMLREARANEDNEPVALAASELAVVVTEQPAESSSASAVRRTDSRPFKTQTAEPTGESTSPSSRRKPWLVALALSATLLFGWGGATLVLSLTADPVVSEPLEPSATLPPLPAPPPDVDEVPIAVEPADEPAEPTRVQVTIDSLPAGALVTVDGIARGNAPVQLAFPAGEEPITLELSLEGRRTTQTRFVPDHDQALTVSLPAGRRGGRRGGSREPGGSDGPGGFFAFE